jgi:hypothetical protein
MMLVSACAAASDSGSPPDDEYTLPLPSDAKPGSLTPPVLGAVSGVLTFDDIEGGCAFIETPEKVRYEVIYPDGWVLDRVGAVLRGPAGEEVPAGETLRIRGSVATDRSSICQVGPIFEATAVEVAAG